MVKEKSTYKFGSKKWSDLSVLVLSLVSVVLINYLSGFFFERFDLTAENRYTLSDATVESLEALDDVVFVRVYLEGNLPTEFQELRDAVKETLDEFRAYSGGRIEYEFINPSASPDEQERINVYKELTNQGLQYTNVRMRTGDKVSEQIIFPGAIVAFGGQETSIQLLRGQAGISEDEMITSSIQQLEYAFISSIKKLAEKRSLRVAFIEGHGELDRLQTADAEQALSEFYEVERVEINEQLDALKTFDAIIIARPDSAYSEKDKFVIDQFVMRGGKVLWCVDPVFARMDSLKRSQFTMGLVLEHNLDDQLFKYGARLNSDLVMDLEALPIPIVTGMIGDQPNYEMFPWYYMPLLMGSNEHPISKNLDRLKSEFSSTVESVQRDGVNSTVLLTSSNKARVIKAPARISFNILREAPRYELYNEGPLPVGMLLEGSFESVFKNRLPKKILEDDGIQFRESSIPTKMIVVADGDIIANEVNRLEERYFTLGYYKYTEQVYGNREFLLNAMNYLMDDSGLLNVRSKEIKLRLLDQEKIDEERYFWQIMNTGLPILIILAVGISRMYLRRRKYAS